MGRKRSDVKKRNLNLWVEKDLVDQLHKLELTPSVVFTDAVKELLEKVEKGEITIKNSDKVEKDE